MDASKMKSKCSKAKNPDIRDGKKVAMRKRITEDDVAREAKEEGHSAKEELREKQRGPGNARLSKHLRASKSRASKTAG